MPQSLVVGNGNMLVNFDDNLQMRDFYYPHVGEENHTAFQKMHRTGVWVDGQFSWLFDPAWQIDVRYHDNTLVGNSTAYNSHLGLTLRFEDFVYTTHDVTFRKITVRNDSEREREIRIFCAFDFYLYGDKMQDTAQYEPDLHAILHYRKERYLLVNGRWNCSNKGFDQFSIGKSEYYGREGTWKDCEDGHLHGNPIEQGSVDSAVGFHEQFKSGEEKVLYVWIAAGKNYQEILKNNGRVFELGPDKIFDHTFHYWCEWATKEKFLLTGLREDVRMLFHRSLLLIRSQIDNGGAVIASSDSDIMQFNKDNYSYIWPRDGAFVSMALSRANCGEVVRNFLFFCEKIIEDDGYVFTKYTPTGSVGSSWHPKMKNGEIQLPIQEDAPALILVALRDYYNDSRYTETVQKLFNSVVLRIGRFLMKFRDPSTGLPLASYDLWEEYRGVFPYTASTVYAGLRAAGDLSKSTGHSEHADEFYAAAEDIRQSIVEHLYSEDDQRFYKKVVVKDGKIIERDNTIDASLAFVWDMGVLPADDPRVVSTMEAIERALWCQTDIGGIVRYTGDNYQRTPGRAYTENIPGNPWIITTLWLANWHIERAKNIDSLERPKKLIEWCLDRQNAAGILPEQTDPFDNRPLSVAPLTWSHSTFVDTCLRWSQKRSDIS